MSDKPREFWIDHVGDTVDGEFDAIVCDKEPPHIAIHVIEYAALEKLKAELAEYKERFSDARKTALAHSEELTFRGQRISDLKAKLAEVEAELEKLRSRHLWNSTYADTEEGLKNLDCSPEVLNSIKTRRQLERELTREREAVKSLSDQLEWSLKNEAQYKNAMKKAFEVETVMREALEQIQSLAANEHEQGDSKALDDVLDLTCETFKALAKADEIRGGE